MLWQSGVVNLITETRPSTDLLQHMMQQCYRRSVTNPDNLKQYRPFSPEVDSWAVVVILLGPFHGAIAVPSVTVVVVVDIDFTLPFARCRYCHTPPAL